MLLPSIQPWSWSRWTNADRRLSAADAAVGPRKPTTFRACPYAGGANAASVRKTKSRRFIRSPGRFWQISYRLNQCLGRADIVSDYTSTEVRPMSGLGQKRKCDRLRGMSVLPSTADIVRPPRHVRLVQPAKADICAAIRHVRFTHRSILSPSKFRARGWFKQKRPLTCPA